MKPIDQFRCKILSHLSQTPTFQNSWHVLSDSISRFHSATPTENEIFSLGENLSEVFRSNAVAGRDQSSVSGGGVAWECLITWYLNLVFWNSNVIATRQNMKFIPQVISNSLTVTISNQQTNTESDVVVYSLPTEQENMTISDIDHIVRQAINEVNVAVVQCKTNWNDNAQVPMLWDLIYNSRSFRIPNISVGVNGVSPASFARFAYAFVTVPTSRGQFNPTSLAVLRVKNMTGGNYWGKQSSAGVAMCINEFFGKNFPSAFVGGVQSHIARNLRSDPNYWNRFKELDFSSATL